MIEVGHVGFEWSTVDVIVEWGIVETLVQTLQGQLQSLGESGLLFGLEVAEGGGMPARHDPGLKRRAGRVRGKDDERLVLEDDAGAGAPLVIEGAAEDTLGLRLIEAAGTRQLVEEARWNQRDRVKLRVRVLQRSTGRPAMVVKHDHMLQHGVLRVLPVPVDIRLHDLLNLRAGQQRHRSNFWLNHDLGMMLWKQKPPRPEEERESLWLRS